MELDNLANAVIGAAKLTSLEKFTLHQLADIGMDTKLPPEKFVALVDAFADNLKADAKKACEHAKAKMSEKDAEVSEDDTNDDVDVEDAIASIVDIDLDFDS